MADKENKSKGESVLSGTLPPRNFTYTISPNGLHRVAEVTATYPNGDHVKTTAVIDCPDESAVPQVGFQRFFNNEIAKGMITVQSTHGGKTTTQSTPSMRSALQLEKSILLAQGVKPTEPGTAAGPACPLNAEQLQQLRNVAKQNLP